MQTLVCRVYKPLGLVKLAAQKSLKTFERDRLKSVLPVNFMEELEDFYKNSQINPAIKAQQIIPKPR